VVRMEKWPWHDSSACVRELGLGTSKKEPLVILCLGAHSDDIEIGCGGTLLRLKAAFSKLKFHWVVFSAAEIRGREAAKSADLFTAGREKEIVLKNYRDGFFPYVGKDLKDSFEELKGRVNPDVVFTHWQGDAHQDHRLISELTWNTFRNHLILEYEVPKFDGDLGRPNLFVPLDAPLFERKVDFLFEAFQSQQSKRWFDREIFLGLMRIRGMESNSASGYAEAFYCRKLVLGVEEHQLPPS
jgi:LmbE family N-acetylglucosaminyl deacetylase